MSDTPKNYESDTPETCEAVERWQQGKINIFDEMARLERERNEALYDAAQQTIKVSLIKSRWIAARQALESIAEGTSCRECDGEDQARLAREALDASK